MKKKIGLLIISVIVFAGISSASSESLLKAGIILGNKDEDFYSWLLIYESNYFIKGLISIGYEAQISYYKIKSIGSNFESTNSAYPFNIFFNSKVNILKKGTFRPYAGAGFGLLTKVVQYPDRYGWEKFNAVHMMVGVNIGKGSKTDFQIELRWLDYDKKESSAKYVLVVGINY